MHTCTHILSTCRVCPGTSPQVRNLLAPSRWPGLRPPPAPPLSLPGASAQPQRLPGRGGAGGGRPLPRGGPGAGRGAGGAGGGAGGRRGGVPPSLALPGKVSRCCRAQPRLLLLLPRPGGGDCAPTSARAAPPRPPARQHGHHRHLHPLHRRLSALRGARQVRLVRRQPGPPTPCPCRPGAMRLLAPPPGPAPAAAAPPRPTPPPAFPASRLPGPPSPPAPCPAAPSAPCSSCPGCCTPRCRGDCSPRSAPGRPPAPPLPHPSGAPPNPNAACLLPPPHSVQELTQHPVPRPTRLRLRTLPGPAAPTLLRCPAVGDAWYPAPPPASAASRIPAPLLGSAAAPPSPPPIPAVVPGAARRSRSIPLPSALSRPLHQPWPPTPTRGAEPGHCSPRPARPPGCFQSWRVRAPIEGWGACRGKCHGEGELLMSETHNWVLSFPAIS